MPTSVPDKNPAARRIKSAKLNPRVATRRTSRIMHSPVVEVQVEEKRRPFMSRFYPSLVLASFLLGTFSSYMAWGRKSKAVAGDIQPAAASSAASTTQEDTMDVAALLAEVNPTEGYQLPVRYGDLGPRLVKSGAINYEAFAGIYKDAGNPLTQAQVDILRRGSKEQVIITARNAHFLLNFFWAVGVANKNPILTNGAMVQYSGGRIESYASTGGWTLGTKPVTEIYASLDLIPLTPEQQARVDEVASAVYRPCCDNPTIFPDCNHGMAMLGLLELLASQNASVDDMFQAAKHVNAFWFPQQALETAIYLKANQDVDFGRADARLVTGKDLFSASGSNRVYTSLQSSGLLPKVPGGNGGCAN